jgi:YbbR domain-containing protein
MPGNNKANKGKSIFSRRNLLVFVVCLAISTLFWLLLAFNGFYSTSITVPVEYINMPEQRMMIEKLPQEVEITISGSGYQLISYWLRPDNGSVLLDGRNIGTKPALKANNAFLTTFNGIDFFNRQHGDVKALNIQPDTIFFSFFNRGFRKVPIVLDAVLSFKKQYFLTDSIRLFPDSVMISGPSERMDSVFQIFTERLKLSDISTSGNFTLNILKPDSLLSYEPSLVDIKMEVDQYTEAVFAIPVRVEHLISTDSLDVFPEQVELTCLIALKDFNKVSASSFIIAADAFDLRDSKSNSMKLYVREAPSFVKNIRLKPETVDFIIRQK